MTGRGAALPLRRAYFGVIFSLDLLINILLYIIFAAVSTEGWDDYWEKEVANYDFTESCFDVMLVDVARALLLLYIYSYRESTQTTIPIIVIFCSTAFWISFKLSYFEGTKGIDLTLMIFSLVAAIIEVIILYSRLQSEKKARKYNRFIDAVESSTFVINTSNLSGYHTFQSNKNSIVPAAFVHGGVDIREVPNGFTKKVEWSQKIGDLVSNEMNTEAQDYHNWKFLAQSEDTFVYCKDGVPNSMIYLKSITVLPGTPMEIQSLLADVSRRVLWDPLCVECSRVEEIGTDSEILYLITPNMGPMSSRDMCCIRRLCPRIDEGFSLVMRSVIYQDRPEVQSYIRAELSLSGFQVKPHKTINGSCLVSYITIMDVKGWIPERIGQLFAELHPQTLLNIKNLLTKSDGTISPNISPVTTPAAHNSPEMKPHRHTISNSNGQHRNTYGRSSKRDKRKTTDDMFHDDAGRYKVRGSLASHFDGNPAESRCRPNILPRIFTHEIPKDTLIRDYDEFLQRWEDLYKMAVDLHLEDRAPEAYTLVQTVLRSLDQHLQFARERVTEENYWKREGDLGKIQYFMNLSRQVDIIKTDALEFDAWMSEMQNKSGWTSLSPIDDVMIWKRYERGRALPTLKYEAIMDAPLSDCLAIISEIDQVKEWIPRTGSHGLVDITELARLTRLGRIARMFFRLPFPFDDREVIVRIKGYDGLHRGHALILVQTITSFPGLDIPEPRPGSARMHLNAGFLLSPVTKAQTKVTFLTSMDPAWIVPVFLPVRNWVAEQIFTNIFILFRNKAQKVTGSDMEGWMENQPDLYGFMERRMCDYVDGLDLTMRTSGVIDPESVVEYQ